MTEPTLNEQIADLEAENRALREQLASALKDRDGRSIDALSRLLELDEVKVQRDSLRSALEKILENVNDDCRIDHDGNCQAHFLERSCSKTAVVRSVPLSSYAQA